MPRQNPNSLSSASNLRSAATTIRAAVGSGTFEDLKSALTAAAGALDQAEGALSAIEQRLRELGEANTNDPRRPAGVLVSGDRIRGGVQVQGELRSVMGQGMGLTFESQVSQVKSYDYGADVYLPLNLDGLGVTINAHGGTITLTGTLSLSAVLTVPMGGTGTATGSITGTGALAFTSGGTNTNITLLTNGTGKVILKPGTNSVDAVQAQNAAGVAVLDVDTTNARVGVGLAAPLRRLDVAQAADTVADGIGVANTAATSRLNLWMNGTAGRIDSGGTGSGVLILNAGGGSVGLGTTAPTSPLHVVGLPVYADNATAVTGGLTAGALYRLNSDPDTVAVVH